MRLIFVSFRKISKTCYSSIVIATFFGYRIREPVASRKRTSFSGSFCVFNELLNFITIVYCISSKTFTKNGFVVLCIENLSRVSTPFQYSKEKKKFFFCIFIESIGGKAAIQLYAQMLSKPLSYQPILHVNREHKYDVPCAAWIGLCMLCRIIC